MNRAVNLSHKRATGPATLPLLPGSWLGIMGGGQLGRMFCMAAHALGFRVAVLDPDEHSPAAACADWQIPTAYTDERGLSQLAQRCGAVSTEFENVPADSLEWLAARVAVAPGAAAVSIAQDRIREKEFIQAAGIAVAPYAIVRSRAELENVGRQLFPAILKTARLGYDGKGQVQVANGAAALQAFAAMGEPACVLEQKLDLAAELSVVIARGFDGQTVAYPVAQNVHRDGILAVSTVPAAIAPALARQVVDSTLAIADAMNYVGVLCVEFFLLRNGEVIVNEMAPRPHNSGHYSIDACVTSQFEQQARAMAGLPLGSTQLKSAAVMLNLLGDLWFDDSTATQAREPDWPAVLSQANAKLHLYGKREARRGRKMGHITVLGRTSGEALDTARQLAGTLHLPL